MEKYDRRQTLTRRSFLGKTAATGLTIGLTSGFYTPYPDKESDVRIGMIGLDTSHSIAFTGIINNTDDKAMAGYRVVAAYPYGSKTIESSYSRIPGYIEDIKKLDVEIVGSIEELLKMTDVVLLETNDGNLHLEQALEVFRAGKPLFIDKPVAGSLEDALKIYKAAGEYKVPVFSSSSLRWSKNTEAIRQGELVGKVLGAFTYSPAHIEPSHPDLYWYGVHGVEMLYSVMGTGCQEVIRIHQDDFDIVTGIWEDGRLGTFHGARRGNAGFGGTALGEKGAHEIGPYEGYRPAMTEVIKFFKTGIAPVSPAETIEIFTFMEAADESRRRGGKAVRLEEVLSRAMG
jgi:predicted dehydrogenase